MALIRRLKESLPCAENKSSFGEKLGRDSLFRLYLFLLLILFEERIDLERAFLTLSWASIFISCI